MDEALATEHLSYGKDELQTTNDVIQEDNLETISSATVDATSPFNKHDYSVLGDVYPMKPKKRISLGEHNENTTKELTENTILGSENWEQKHYDQNNLCGKESSREIPLLSDHRIERSDKTHNVREELQDDITPGIHKSQLDTDKRRCNFMPYDYDDFNGSFANNSVINSIDNDNKDDVKYSDNNSDNAINNILAKRRNDSLWAVLSPDNMISNGAQYSSLAKQTSDFKLISHNKDAFTTWTNDSSDNADDSLKDNSTKEQSSEDSTRKTDDVGKISDRLEAFNRNNEVSSIPIKTSRPKIEETEMPTK
ncbi:hypothetical protein WUBG_06646, partial [Wuchereria bancrofti]